LRNPAEITAAVVEQHSSEQTFLMTVGELTIPVRTCLTGTANVYRCLTAAAVGLTYGIDPATVVAGLESLSLAANEVRALDDRELAGEWFYQARRTTRPAKDGGSRAA
jgi:UDP-N-acetylmuramyl pentapeptide synthase